MPSKRKTKKATSFMSDSELADAGRQYKKAQQREAKWKKTKQAVGKELAKEFDARGTHLLENDGVRVTDTIQMRTVYDFDELEARLGSKVARKFQKREVDPTALSQMIQSGRVDAAIVADCSYEVEHARYPTVSFTEK